MRKKSKKVLSLLIAVATMMILSGAMMFNAYADDKERVNDKGAILTDKQEAALTKKMNSIVEEYNIDMAIHTTEGMGTYTSVKSYAGNYFNSNGYGIGNNKDGYVFVIDMKSREFWMWTNGYCEKVFNGYGGEYIKDKITPKLKKGDYYGAFDAYLDYVDEFMHEAKTNKPYSHKHPYRTMKDKMIAEGIIVLVALLIAFITVTIMKRMMNNVHKATLAREYVRGGSMNITEQRDIFLYRNISKTRKAQESNSSSDGASGSHGTGGSF